MQTNKNTTLHTAASQDSLTAYQRRFWAFWASIVGLRLCFLFFAPLELAADEAYYWDWGRIFDWGYYSKPPLIGWINSLTTALFGATSFSVRLPTVIFGAAGLIALFYLARRLFDDRAAFWAVLLASLSPGACVLNFIMTIDAPLMCSWLFALFFFWRAIENQKSSSWWWWMLALAIGVGSLSKQMMLTFPLLMLLFFAISQEDRMWLRSPRTWLAIFGGLAFLAPPIIWNASHDWITFQHSAHHFEGSSSFWRFLKTVPDFVGGQFLLVAPLTMLAYIYLSVRLLSTKAIFRDRRILFLLLFSFLPLVLFFVQSFRQRIYGNWPAVFYPTGIILTAAWLTGSLKFDGNTMKSSQVSWLRFWAPATGALLVALTYGLTFVMVQSDNLAGPNNPLTPLTGWQKLADEADLLRRELPRPDKVFFVADHRQTVAELAFYLPDQPRVYIWNEKDELVNSQYDLWPGPEDKKNWDAVILFDVRHPPSEKLTSCFGNFSEKEPLDIRLGKKFGRRFTVYIGKDLQDWQ